MVSSKLRCAAAWLLAAVLAAACPHTAAAQDKDEDKSDQDRLQGTWEVASAQKGNEKLPEELLKTIKITFKGEKLSFEIVGDTKEGSFKIDPKKKPKEIDLTVDGKTAKGVYAFEGDRLKVCSGEPDEARPKNFDAGDSFTLVVLKRVAAKEEKKNGDKKPQARAAARAVPVAAQAAGGEKGDKEYFQGDWEVASAEKGGVKFPEEVAKTVKMSIKGDKVKIEVLGETKDGTYKLGTDKDSKTIDIKADDKAILGIYKIEKGTFTICVADPGSDRPKEFKADANTSNTLIVWKRAKKAEDKNEDKKPKLDGAPGTRQLRQAPARAQDGALKTQSSNNLKQIGLALHGYHDANKKFPGNAIYSKDGKALLSWRVAILPYLDQQQLYNQFKHDEPWDSEDNKKLIAKMPKVYEVPGADAAGKTVYLAFTGPGTVFEGKDGIRITGITDGSSNTGIVAEAGTPVEWTKPDDLPVEKGRDLPKLGGVFRGNFHVLFADGSVRFMENVNAETLRAIISRNGGEVIPNN